MIETTPTIVVSIHRDPFDVYIGRAGKGQPGTFGNPFVPGRNCTRADCLDKFRAYFLDRVETDAEFRAAVLALKGKRLGCFCAPKGGLTAAGELRCHGQVIAWWLDCGGAGR